MDGGKSEERERVDALNSGWRGTPRHEIHSPAFISRDAWTIN